MKILFFFDSIEVHQCICISMFWLLHSLHAASIPSLQHVFETSSRDIGWIASMNLLSLQTCSTLISKLFLKDQDRITHTVNIRQQHRSDPLMWTWERKHEEAPIFNLSQDHLTTTVNQNLFNKQHDKVSPQRVSSTTRPRQPSDHAAIVSPGLS